MPAVASRGRGRRTISEINMVPFIDVMLVLLIIFMVTAPLITPSMIDLPTVGKGARQPDQVIQVVIGKDEQAPTADLAPRKKGSRSGQNVQGKDGKRSERGQGGDSKAGQNGTAQGGEQSGGTAKSQP